MQFISENNFAALVGTSNATVRKWAKDGVYPTHEINGIKGFYLEELGVFPEVTEMLRGCWDEELNTRPLREYTAVELLQVAEALLSDFRWRVLPMSCLMNLTGLPAIRFV